MKKFFSMMLLLATIMAFTACSDDDSDDVKLTKAQVLGIWGCGFCNG